MVSYCKYLLLFIFWSFSHSTQMIFLYNEVKLMHISFIDCSFSVFISRIKTMFSILWVFIHLQVWQEQVVYTILSSSLFISLKSQLRPHLGDDLSFFHWFECHHRSCKYIYACVCVQENFQSVALRNFTLAFPGSFNYCQFIPVVLCLLECEFTILILPQCCLRYSWPVILDQ